MRPPAVRFSWDISYDCNYRCAYCWWDPSWEALARRYPERRSAESWAEAWGRVGRKFGPLEIQIVGGEPFLFANFADLVGALSGENRVHVTTNLSPSRDRLEEFAAKIRRENVRVSASFHPGFAVFEDFLDKVKPLHALGLIDAVTFVAYPPHLGELSARREALRGLGIWSTAWVFTGTYNGRAYPAAYGEEEKALLRSIVPEDRVEYNLDRKPTRGKPCHSGQWYANVKPNGDVYRCGQAAIDGPPMGNLFDPAFALYDGPKPCPVDKCVCGEFIYLAEEWEKRRRPAAAAAGGAP